MQVISMQAMCQRADLLSGVEKPKPARRGSRKRNYTACNVQATPWQNCAECKAVPAKSRRNRAFQRGTIPARADVFVQFAYNELTRSKRERNRMLHWTIIFLVVALLAAALGFAALAGTAAAIAKVLFVIFLVLFLVSLIRRNA
jgi:uncharacterized membrane protein YtjA (UPF0391 family)